MRRCDFRPGAGGLPTSRLTCRLATGALTVGHQTPVSYQDRSDEGRVGWHEIIARGDQTTLSRSDVPATSVSRALTAYPKDLLSSPLAVKTAALVASPGGAAAADPLAGTDAPAGKEQGRGVDGLTVAFTDLVGRHQLSIGIGLLAVVLALHPRRLSRLRPRPRQDRDGRLSGGRPRIAAPGQPDRAVRHGDPHPRRPDPRHPAVDVRDLRAGEGLSVARGRQRPAAAEHRRLAAARRLAAPLALVRAAAGPRSTRTTITHPHTSTNTRTTSTGIPRPSAPHRTAPHAHHAGGGAPAAVLERPVQPLVHSHGGRTHSHAPITDQPLRLRSLLTMGLAGGLVPSPSALVVLVGAIALHRAWFGVVLVVFYGAGMAVTLVGIGLLLSRLRGRFIRRVQPGSLLSRAFSVLPVATALLICVIGTVLAFRGLGQA